MSYAPDESWVGKVSLPSSNVKMLLRQRPLDPEIRSFEKCYIGWVKITVSNFFQCTKVHKVIAPPSGVSVVFSTLFRLTISCSILKFFTVKPGSCPKSGPNFHVSGPPNF